MRRWIERKRKERAVNAVFNQWNPEKVIAAGWNAANTAHPIENGVGGPRGLKREPEEGLMAFVARATGAPEAPFLQISRGSSRLSTWTDRLCYRPLKRIY